MQVVILTHGKQRITNRESKTNQIFDLCSCGYSGDISFVHSYKHVVLEKLTLKFCAMKLKYKTIDRLKDQSIVIDRVDIPNIDDNWHYHLSCSATDHKIYGGWYFALPW